jgi:hypothetical protein
MAVPAALLCLSTQAMAQWTKPAGGGTGYLLNYVSSGVFSCGRYLDPGSCLANGNSLTLWNLGLSMTLTFNGGPNSVEASSKQSTLTAVGTLSSVSDPGFVLPAIPNINVPYIYFSVLIALSPGPGGGWHGGGFLLRGNQLKMASLHTSNIISIRKLAPPPTPNNYRVITFQRKVPTVVNSSGSVTLYDSVSLTPEPATIALLSTGLAGIGGFRAFRRRRRARHVQENTALDPGSALV